MEVPKRRYSLNSFRHVKRRPRLPWSLDTPDAWKNSRPVLAMPRTRGTRVGNRKCQSDRQTFWTVAIKLICKRSYEHFILHILNRTFPVYEYGTCYQEAFYKCG